LQIADFRLQILIVDWNLQLNLQSAFCILQFQER